MVVATTAASPVRSEYYAYGPTNVEAVNQPAESEGYDLARCCAYSESITKVPMPASAGHPYAVNRDRSPEWS